MLVQWLNFSLLQKFLNAVVINLSKWVVEVLRRERCGFLQFLLSADQLWDDSSLRIIVLQLGKEITDELSVALRPQDAFSCQKIS